MEKSDVFRAIIRIQEYCKGTECKNCELHNDDEDVDECLLYPYPAEWNTDDIPYNILEEEE